MKTTTPYLLYVLAMLFSLPVFSQGNIDLPIEGSIEIDGNKIKAKISMWVESGNFKYADNNMVLDDSSEKGLVFMYHDFVNPYNSDNGSTVKKIYEFEFYNIKKWKEGDKIRIMCLNENNEIDFRGLENYFMERMKKFGKRLASSSEYADFNCDWNEENPDNPVCCCERLEKSKKDTVPRFTKTDGIFTLQTKLATP